ncbi:MAG: hypothetical protein L6R37_007624 [Teloschistes peruensis]|nr:MAG: hypothetical protein L6R37_007624 [Teloschistes peruensis]
MTCSGCSGAVDRVLKKMDGIENYKVSLETQSAEVWTGESVGFEAVLQKIKKTGKTVTGGVRDGVPVEVPVEGAGD